MNKKAIITAVAISLTASILFEFIIKPKIEELKNA
jgi:hypothetical protein